MPDFKNKLRLMSWKYFDDFQDAFFLPQETDSCCVEGNINQHAPPAVLYAPLRLELAPHISLKGLLNS